MRRIVTISLRVWRSHDGKKAEGMVRADGAGTQYPFRTQESSQFRPLRNQQLYSSDLALPSFGDHVTWSIYRPAPRLDSTVHVLQELSWQQLADSSRMMDPLVGAVHPLHFRPVPGIIARTVEVSGVEVDAMLQVLSRIQIKTFPPAGPMGLDGESFGVETSLGFTKSTLSWWCQGPTEWGDLLTWTHNTIATFNNALKDQTVERISGEE